MNVAYFTPCEHVLHLVFGRLLRRDHLQQAGAMNEKTISDFASAWKSSFGEELSAEQALDEIERLTNFFEKLAASDMAQEREDEPPQTSDETLKDTNDPTRVPH